MQIPAFTLKFNGLEYAPAAKQRKVTLITMNKDCSVSANFVGISNWFYLTETKSNYTFGGQYYTSNYRSYDEPEMLQGTIPLSLNYGDCKIKILAP